MRFHVVWRKSHEPEEAYRDFFETNDIYEAKDFAMRLAFDETNCVFVRDEQRDEIVRDVKNSAYEIINRKHATYYGVAMAVKRICEAIVMDEKSILPVSHMIHGAYGIEDVVISMPAVVGADGLETNVPIVLSGDEALKLKESADALKEIVDSLEL